MSLYETYAITSDLNKCIMHVTSSSLTKFNRSSRHLTLNTAHTCIQYAGYTESTDIYDLHSKAAKHINAMSKQSFYLNLTSNISRWIAGLVN